LPNRLSPNEAKILQQSVEITRLRRALEKALQVVSRDCLTGLASRHRIMEEIEHHLGIYRRERMCGDIPTHFSVLLADLNRLKSINDTLGHGAGDEALIMFANYLTTSIRDGDIAGRLGGDEFIIIAIGMTKDRASEYADMLEEGLSSLPLTIRGNTFILSASIGIASTSEGFETKAELLHNADMRMYDHKRGEKSAESV
jgi:two-component system cell cycle response regulator